MFKGLILQIVTGILSFWLAIKFISGVELVGEIEILFFAGIMLGLVNYFLKPILKFITWPLRIISLGFFTIIINLGLVWGIDILFPELIINGIIPLLWTTIIVCILSFILPKFFPKRKNSEDN